MLRMKKSRKLCWERVLAMSLAAAVFFSGAGLTALATEADTPKPPQEIAVEEPSGEEESSEMTGGGGKRMA